MAIPGTTRHSGAVCRVVGVSLHALPGIYVLVDSNIPQPTCYPLQFWYHAEACQIRYGVSRTEDLEIFLLEK